jgi:hypothetical protein
MNQPKVDDPEIDPLPQESKVFSQKHLEGPGDILSQNESLQELDQKVLSSEKEFLTQETKNDSVKIELAESKLFEIKNEKLSENLKSTQIIQSFKEYEKNTYIDDENDISKSKLSESLPVNEKTTESPKELESDSSNIYRDENKKENDLKDFTPSSESPKNQTKDADEFKEVITHFDSNSLKEDMKNIDCKEIIETGSSKSLIDNENPAKQDFFIPTSEPLIEGIKEVDVTANLGNPNLQTSLKIEQDEGNLFKDTKRDISLIKYIEPPQKSSKLNEDDDLLALQNVSEESEIIHIEIEVNLKNNPDTEKQEIAHLKHIIKHLLGKLQAIEAKTNYKPSQDETNSNSKPQEFYIKHLENTIKNYEDERKQLEMEKINQQEKINYLENKCYHDSQIFHQLYNNYTALSTNYELCYNSYLMAKSKLEEYTLRPLEDASTQSFLDSSQEKINESEILNKKQEDQEIFNKQQEDQEILNKQQEDQEILNKQQEDQEIVNKQQEDQEIVNKQQEDHEIVNKKQEDQEILKKNQENTEILEKPQQLKHPKP